MKRKKISLQDIVPFAAFIVIFAFFEIASGGRMLSPMNLGSILDQSVMTIVVGCGALFVVAQGSIDLSVGVNLALSGVVATWAANAGGGILLIPVALIVALIVGVFNGVIVSRFKVPSFMLTIAMLIGVRGIVNYIQSFIATQQVPESMLVLNQPYIKYPAFIVIVVIMAYVFEFTKVGKYSKAIGENETTASFVGVPVTLMKIVAFGLCGLMAGFAAIFSLTSVGGTSQQMGVFFEMKVAMAIFLGGVLVTGGTSAKLYKVLLGSFSITMIVNGLALIGLSETQYSQSVEGLLLLLILFVTILSSKRTGKAQPDEPDTPAALQSDEKQAVGP
ncbi:ribose transport system permease protein [Sporobacter termitidis DSM 10068]|uniref:Autoinducer 2 import system permease protein LsrC n=1 Tax=Sporobacter termitidis DSM 10068 TaxID=1123282 RepID=A0A1M5Z048_9FIRM|nr:ABC transporter permease [Sporobacter termitidis]SHI17569.1 ribose transport system permease protein [Sporobacter termitidis DSM 10068]